MAPPKKSSVAKLDTLTLKPSETAVAIRHMWTTGVSLFLWGPPGVAKSSVTAQVATSQNSALIDVRLSQMEPTDLRGIPMPFTDNGVAGIKWSSPTVLPKDLNSGGKFVCDAIEEIIYFSNPKGDNGIHHVTEVAIEVKSLTPGLTAEIVEQQLTNFTVKLVDKKGETQAGEVRWTAKGLARGILILDEFNSAAPSVQAGAYQLVLDRRLGEYVVPKGVMIMAAGNRENDKGITFRMPTPIANRFTHIEIRPDFDDWQIWALGANINKDVVGYLTAFKHDMFDFDPASASRGFATPRSWEMVSRILNNNPNISEQILLGLISGAVGDGVALKFYEYRKNAADLPLPSEILSGKVTDLRRNDVSLCYALTTALCYELKESADAFKRSGIAAEKAAWLKQADNFIGYMMKNFQPEVTIMGAKTSLGVFRLPFVAKEMKNFETFTAKYKSMIMA